MLLCFLEAAFKILDSFGIFFRAQLFIKPAIALVSQVYAAKAIRQAASIKDKIGIRRGRYYTVNQIRIIFDEIGLPGIIEV